MSVSQTNIKRSLFSRLTNFQVTALAVALTFFAVLAVSSIVNALPAPQDPATEAVITIHTDGNDATDGAT